MKKPKMTFFCFLVGFDSFCHRAVTRLALPAAQTRLEGVWNEQQANQDPTAQVETQND